MSEKKQTAKKEVQKKEAKAREKPTAVMLFYEKDAVAMGFTGSEDNIAGQIKAKVREAFHLPAPERSAGLNSVLKAKLGLPATATTNELNKAMKKAIAEGRFTPSN